MEAARSDAPDAFQGLFAALAREALEAKSTSRSKLTKVSRTVDAGNFAVVSRSFAAAREVGACADDAAPFRGAAPADVSGVPALPRRARGHGAARRPRRLRRLRGFGRHRPRGRGRAAAPRGGPVDGERRGGRPQTTTARPRRRRCGTTRRARRRPSTASPPGPRRCSACRGRSRVVPAARDAAWSRHTHRKDHEEKHRCVLRTLQLVRYASPAAFYKPHLDCLEEAGQVLLGGQRVGTVLVYLNDVDEGGATRFPALGLEVAPRELQAVAWANVRADGVRTCARAHGARPRPRPRSR